MYYERNRLIDAKVAYFPCPKKNLFRKVLYKKKDSSETEGVGDAIQHDLFSIIGYYSLGFY